MIQSKQNSATLIDKTTIWINWLYNQNKIVLNKKKCGHFLSIYSGKPQAYWEVSVLS